MGVITRERTWQRADHPSLALQPAAILASWGAPGGGNQVTRGGDKQVTYHGAGHLSQLGRAWGG